MIYSLAHCISGSLATINCLLIGRAYQYTRDFLALEVIPTAPLVLDFAVLGILPLSRWDHYLRSHLDREFAEFLRREIDQCYKIGFNRSQELCPLKRNYESSVENPGHTQWYIDEEVSAGRLRHIPAAERESPCTLESQRHGPKGPPTW